MTIERVAVIGGGTMGSGIAEVCAIRGIDTKLVEIDAELAEAAKSRIDGSMERAVSRGKLDVADASTVKVFGTEFYMEGIRLMMEIIGPRAYLVKGSPEAAIAGDLENRFRSLLILTFGGGTNEVQRDLIGMFGLGLPRAPRF